ncbi:MAG: hypothetical protein WAK90_25195 [Pseudolabrys sp.]
MVNGYVCFSSCDEAKAKQGNNPNVVLGTPPPEASDPKKKSEGQPTVILDGVLKELANGTSSPGAPNIADDTNQLPSLNILA